MQSNPRVEEVASDNIVERELQPPKPPKRKKKKLSFVVWWELYAPEELKKSTENIEQQDSALLTENESVTMAQVRVDQRGDRPAFKTCSEEQLPFDQEVTTGNIENQMDSLVSQQESITGVQETLDIAEKEQPSESKEQPPTTRRIKKKKIPFHIWLEKHAPALPEEGDRADSLKKDICAKETPLVTEKAFVSTTPETLDQEEQPKKTRRLKKKKIPFHIWLEKHAPADVKIADESTGKQDVSPVAENPSISVLQEKIEVAQKEESFKSYVENVYKQDDSLPEEGDRADSLKTEICVKETPLVTEKSFVSTTLETLDQQEEEQPKKTRRIKKKKIPFHIWLEKHAPADVKIADESTGKQDVSPVAENPSISVLQKTIEVAQKEESFKSYVENVYKQDDSLPKDGDRADSLKTEICVKETPLVTEKSFVSTTPKTLDQQEEEQPKKTRRIKKKKIPFHIWLEKHAPADVKISPDSTGLHDSTFTKEESISVLQEMTEKEESFNINKQDTSLPEDGDQEDPLTKESCTEGPLISTPEMVTKTKSIHKSETKVGQKGEKKTSKTKRIKKTPLFWKSFPESGACVDLTFLSENSDLNNDPLLENPSHQAALPSNTKKTFWKVFPDSEPCIDLSFFADHIEGQDVPVLAKDGELAASVEKQFYSKHNLISTTTQAKCTCQAKSKQPELGSIELQKYLMRQLDDMFDINRKLSAKLNYQKDLLRKVLSEKRQNRTSTEWGNMWVE